MGMVEFYQKSLGRTGTKSFTKGNIAKQTIDNYIRIPDIILPYIVEQLLMGT